MNAHMGYISNILVINVLHASNIGVGFIPILAVALYLFCILSAAGRTGINPAPSMLQTKQLTFIYFSLTLIISILAFVVLSYRDTKP